MSLIVGLTGGIATGKSTVSRMLKQRNFPVIDADLISREVVKPGKPAYRKIVSSFGEEVLLSNEEIDRKKLGNIIFSDPAKREELNEIVHPAVRKEMLLKRDELIKEKEKLIVLDIPLLFESKLTHMVEKVIVVYTTEVMQLNRLRNRDNISCEDAVNRINSQLSIEKKAEMADEVIDNNGTVKETENQLNDLLRRWDIPTIYN